MIRDGGQVTWVRRDSLRHVPVDGDLMVAAADPDTAWLVDRSVIDPGQPPSPPPPLPPRRILAVHRDGSRTRADTGAPVNAIEIRGTEMWVTLAEPPRLIHAAPTSGAPNTRTPC